MTRTFCRSCIAACGVEVDLDGDRVVRVRGDRSHPVSAGYACANGRAIGLLEHHPRRLLAPRVDGVVVTPSEAAASLAARLEGVPTALYQGTGAGFDASLWEAWRRLAAARGWRRCTSLTVDAVAKPYVAELVAGDARLVPHPDPAASLLLVIGSNPVVSHGHTVAVSDPVRALRSWPDVWVLDPRRTETAQLAAHHLAVRPGTDHLVVGLLVKDAGGLPDVVGDLTVAGVASVAGVEPASLEALLAARRRAGRVAFLSGTGSTMAATANLTEWLLWCLAAVTDSFERPGGMWFHPGTVAPLGARRRSRRAPSAGPVRWGQHPSAGLLPAMESGAVRALVVTGGNPLTAFPQPTRVRAALAGLDVLAVLDVLDGPLTELATHVLPCPTQLERPDVSLPTDLAQPIRIAQRTPALREAPPGVRSGSWWASALGGEAVDLVGQIDEAEVVVVDADVPEPWALVDGEPLDLAPAPLVAEWRAWRPPAGGGVRLLPRRESGHVNSTFPRPPSPPVLSVAPADADAGVDVGPWGLAVRVDPTLRPGTATIAGGYPDAPVNELVSTDDLDPATGMPRLSGIAIDLQEQP